MIYRWSASVLAVISVSYWCASSDASAATFYVDGTKATNGTGSGWSTAFNNLQSAIAAAATNPLDEDQIWVPGSAVGITYKPGATRVSTFQLQNNVKIYGGFVGTETPAQFALRDPVANLTILSGEIGNSADTTDNCHHVVSALAKLEFGKSVLDGFTITGGNTFDESRDPPEDFRGGGILIKVLGNGETNACRPIIARGILKDNLSALDGGGAAAVAAGGLSAPACEPWFVNCEFRGNEATRHGGGLAAVSAAPTVMNAILHDNTAGDSGGGAALVGSFTSMSVLSSTFSGNHAWKTGGLAALSGAFLTTTNSIYWGNSDDSSATPDQISNENAKHCCIQAQPLGLPADANIDADPLFLNAAGGDFRLALNSPCIDVGLTAALPPDVANIDADGGVDALSEATPLDFGLARRVSYTLAGTIDACAPDALDMGAYENGDCDGDGTRDQDEVDIGGSASGADGIPDDCQDCNGNSVLDTTELAGNDCNHNGRLDECDIALGCSLDANGKTCLRPSSEAEHPGHHSD